MKTLLLPFGNGMLLKSLTSLVMVLVTAGNIAVAQLPPDCSTGNFMYSIFNDSTGSGTNKPSEIRPVNYATGAIGALMGGTTYLIKSQNLGGRVYYGSSALGVDGITQRFYVNTQMGNPGPKDFISIDPVPATQVTIGSTPSTSTTNVPIGALGTGSGLDNYHFVKMAISPTGTGYAIGVIRDTTLCTPALANPLISFTTCNGSLAPGCSTITLLGFLQSGGVSNYFNLFNGDIAFDSGGNLFFATAAFAFVKGIPRYTDARLFRINALDIPSVPGAGVIPMTFLADYNTLDSTVINGIAFSAVGAMFLSTRRFQGVQTSPVVTPYLNELYSSPTLGTANVVAGFGPHTAGYSIADLGSCYFPTGVLAQIKVQLSGKYGSGQADLKWEVNDNTSVDYFEIQRSNDGADFATIGQLSVKNTTEAAQKYLYNDPQSGFGNPVFYRIRQVMKDGLRFYSNILKVGFNNKINLVSKPKPNPFNNYIDVNLQLKNTGTVVARLADQSGRNVYNRYFDGQKGENKITLVDVGRLKPGLYILELTMEEEVIREKIIKQ